jgi:hypothetical protein
MLGVVQIDLVSAAVANSCGGVADPFCSALPLQWRMQGLCYVSGLSWIPDLGNNTHP